MAHRENLAHFQSPCFCLLHKNRVYFSVYNFATEASYFAKYFAEVSTEVVFHKVEAFDGTSSQPSNLSAEYSSKNSEYFGWRENVSK